MPEVYNHALSPCGGKVGCALAENGIAPPSFNGHPRSSFDPATAGRGCGEGREAMKFRLLIKHCIPIPRGEAD
jgi:hypothetical protein